MRISCAKFDAGRGSGIGVGMKGGSTVVRGGEGNFNDDNRSSDFYYWPLGNGVRVSASLVPL